MFFCDGAMYVEKLVAEVLGVPVFAVGLTMVMPDEQSPPPFFGLRPARTILGQDRARVVRRMLASTMKAGVLTYNDILASHGIAPIPLDGFPDAPMASARRVFLNGSPGLEFPGYRPPDNAEYVGPLVPARGALGPDTALPPAVLDPDAKVVVVSQGTVDNTDPTKLIVPTLEALEDGPYVVVATTAGAQTAELRDRFASPNVVIEDFIDYDALFPHVDVFVTNGGFGSVLAAMRARCSGRGRRQDRREERHRRSGRLQPPRRRPPQRAPETGPHPRRGAARARRPDVRRQRRRRCGRSSIHTTPWAASRPRSTTSRSPRSADTASCQRAE